MSRIDIEFHDPYGDNKENDGGKIGEGGEEMKNCFYDFPPTESAMNCHYSARGMPRNLISSSVNKNQRIEDDEDDDFSPSFLWGSVYSVATLGGLFFSNSTSSGSGSGSTAVSESEKTIGIEKKMTYDGNSCMVTNQSIENDNDVLDVPNSIPKNIGYAFDNLLKISVAASGADNLLFKNTNDIDASEFTILITTQLNILKDLIEELLNNKVIGNVSITKNHPQYYQYYYALCTSANKEIDAVLLLTWVSRMINNNKERIHLIWSNMHGMYKYQLYLFFTSYLLKIMYIYIYIAYFIVFWN